MDENQEFLEREIGFDSIEDERDKNERDYDESKQRNGSDGGSVFVSHIRFEPFCEFFIVFREIIL